jgi:hypothetical protein
MPTKNKTAVSKKTVTKTGTVPPEIAAHPAATQVAGETTTSVNLSALVHDITTFLDAAEPKLGPEPTVTTATQKRRVSKPRKGADKVLPVIASIVKQHGLDSSSLSSSTVMDAYGTAQTLLPLQTRLQKMSKRVSDAAFGAQTTAWAQGLQLYQMLKRRAKTDGQVAVSIAPLAQVFAYRNPVVKSGKPTKRETHVKALVKHVAELAGKHGVTLPGAGASAGSSSGAVGTGPVQAQVQAAPVGAVAVPVTQQSAAVPATGMQAAAPVAQPVAGQAPASSAAPVAAVGASTPGQVAAPAGAGTAVPFGQAAAGTVAGH